MLKCYTWILAQKSQSDTRKTTKWILRSAQELSHLKNIFYKISFTNGGNSWELYNRIYSVHYAMHHHAKPRGICSSGNTGMLAQDFHSMVVFRTGPDFFPIHLSRCVLTNSKYNWKLQNRIYFVHYAMCHHAKPRSYMLKCFSTG